MKANNALQMDSPRILQAEEQAVSRASPAPNGGGARSGISCIAELPYVSTSALMLKFLHISIHH